MSLKKRPADRSDAGPSEVTRGADARARDPSQSQDSITILRNILEHFLGGKDSPSFAVACSSIISDFVEVCQSSVSMHLLSRETTVTHFAYFNVRSSSREYS